MPRFFVTKEDILTLHPVVAGSDAEHMRVLRLRVGDEVTLCDGEGTDCLCRISAFSGGSVCLDALSAAPSAGEPPVALTVCCGLPKGGEKSDLIAQKCTELGAASIVFFQSSRSVAKPDAKALQRRIERLGRIAREAAMQSGRGRVPSVRFLPSFEAAAREASRAELALLMYETGERIPLRRALEGASFSSLALITGPEGGFEPEEAELARAMGLQCCSMGPRILRCETAPAAALAAVLYAVGDM